MLTHLLYCCTLLTYLLLCILNAPQTGVAGVGTPGSAHGAPDWDTVSVRTADEDAFDVTEAFDDGIDYDILDRCGIGGM